MSTLPVTAPSQEMVPITSILQGYSATDVKVRFCIKVALRALRALRDRDYTKFDAQTTANCCHGIALLGQELVRSVTHLDLAQLEAEGERRLNGSSEEASSWRLPKQIIQLAELHLLQHIRVKDPQKGVRSDVQKLREIDNRSTYASYNNVVMALKRKYSALVSDAFSQYSERHSGKVTVSDAPIETWGKYLVHRKDQKGITYEPCLFSMQVALGELIATRATIVLSSHIIDPQTGEPTKHYFALLRGNGTDGFDRLSADEISQLDEAQPVVVYGGYSTSANPDNIKKQLDLWAEKFPQLVLACDTSYPQFPKGAHRFGLDISSITPSESVLGEKIELHRRIPGTSASDSSLFCMTHIYLTSGEKVLSQEFPICHLGCEISSAIVAS